MSRSFASRFASVAALMGMSSVASEEEAPKPVETPTPNEGEGGEDEGGEGGEGEGQQSAPVPADEEGGAAAAAAAGANPTQAQMIAAFERDANALVAAERDRCITVFQSPAGAANPAGAAHVLAKTDMDAAAAIEFLGTTTASTRVSPRDRLNGSTAARPVTGGATDAAAVETDPVAKAKTARKARSAKAVAGGAKAVAKAD